MTDKTIEYSKIEGTMIDMARKTTGKKSDVPDEQAQKTRPPSRDNYKYFYIPLELAKEVEDIAEELDRSGSYIVKKACEAFVAKHKATKRKDAT